MDWGKLAEVKDEGERPMIDVRVAIKSANLVTRAGSCVRDVKLKSLIVPVLYTETCTVQSFTRFVAAAIDRHQTPACLVARRSPQNEECSHAHQCRPAGAESIVKFYERNLYDGLLVCDGLALNGQGRPNNEQSIFVRFIIVECLSGVIRPLIAI